MTLERKYKRGLGRVYVDSETGDEYPSVTTIINATLAKGPFLAKWQDKIREESFVKRFEAFCEHLPENVREYVDRPTVYAIYKQSLGAPNAYRDAKGDTGTYIHSMIETYLQPVNKVKPLSYYLENDPRAEKVLTNFKTWMAKTGLTPVKVEHYLCSPTHGYAGTVDLVAKQKIKGGSKQLVLVDFKTGSMQKDQLLQLAAYALAYEELYFVRPAVAYFLKIDVDAGSVGEQMHMYYDDLSYLFEHYIRTLELWKWRVDSKNEWRSW
ncbi:MAG: PD-(D/E)XK nuclease family protein [Candidatus Korobacteraceae bacterium]|jgi:hypothetical protein